jgi:hypothetical protein
MLRTTAAADSVGIRVLLARALDDHARRFYERHGFEAWPAFADLFVPRSDKAAPSGV